jgi:hypothetical protein
MRFFRPGIFIFLLGFLLPLKETAAAATPVVINDQPVPFNVQGVVTNHAVNLSWQWQPAEQRPEFTNFGFEVRRQDGKSTVVSGTSFSDTDLEVGSYTYRVRVQGGAKENGKRVTHVSDWSEPVDAVIKLVCSGPPTIDFMAQPTKRSYSSVPALRLHLTGAIQIPDGCHIVKAAYHVDSGTGIVHSGPLTVNAQGKFDNFVDAIGPDDELPSGGASFSITASAEDEAGPVTGNAFTINLQLQDRFAPHQPGS